MVKVNTLELLEADVERHFVRRVEAIGGKAPKYKTPSRRSAPDRIVMLPRPVRPFTAFCELKRPGECATPAQRREHRKLRRLGYSVLVLDTLEKCDAYCDLVEEMFG